VDWCLDSKVASGDVLIIWDRKVVEKINECGGIHLGCHFQKH
jgi:hypothetical protein